MLTTPFQPSLLGREPPGFDPGFRSLVRIPLDEDETAWLDHAPGWVTGADALFEEVLRARRWGQRTRHMHQGKVLEPRLTSMWTLDSGEPLLPALLEELRRALSERYGVVFDSAGFNLYRDGRDSVAWHGDHIDRAIAEPIVPLVSLGEPRKLLFRPKVRGPGGRSRAFPLGRGDLLVTGGLAQRTWEHAVPKVARAGPRISIAFRYGLRGPTYLANAPDVPGPRGPPRGRRPRQATIASRGPRARRRSVLVALCWPGREPSSHCRRAALDLGARRMDVSR